VGANSHEDRISVFPSKVEYRVDARGGIDGNWKP